MFVKLTKKFITKHLLPHLSSTHLGRRMKVKKWRIIKAIIYRLKTGTQWREIPIACFASPILLSWQTVYYHFNKWSKDGSWKRLWTALLKLNKTTLDMSSVQIDGSHTPAKRGGEDVGYQGRKKCKTTNALFLTDKQGIPLVLSDPVSGNHHDLFEIKKQLKKMVDDLTLATISSNGLFVNGDAGFDSSNLREFFDSIDCIANIDINKRNAKNPDYEFLLDEELYKERFSVERTNAWLDAFKALLVRYEVKTRNWVSLHYPAFSIILLRKVHPQHF